MPGIFYPIFVFLYTCTQYIISTTAVIPHEKMYSRYKDGIVLKWANTVFTHTIRKIQDPIITITVGITLFPRAREAAMALVHKCRKSITKSHNRKSFHSGIHNRRIIGKKTQELSAEDNQCNTTYSSNSKGISQADQITVSHSFSFPCTVILPHKASAAV